MYLLTPGLFFGLDLPFTVAGIDYKARKADIIGTGNEAFSITHLDDIGRFLVAILRKPASSKNTIVRVVGDTQTANALVQKFEDKIGEKFVVTYQSAEALQRTLKEAIDKKDYDTYFPSAIPLFTGLGLCSKWRVRSN
jgi:nucleoside-diphosphate-sugar epimerase